MGQQKQDSSNSNGRHYVTQYELNLALKAQKQQLDDIKKSIDTLVEKVDKINEEKLPQVQQNHMQLKTKSKVFWGFLIGGVSLLTSVATILLKSALFG